MENGSEEIRMDMSLIEMSIYGAVMIIAVIFVRAVFFNRLPSGSPMRMQYGKRKKKILIQ